MSLTLASERDSLLLLHLLTGILVVVKKLQLANDIRLI